MLFLCIRCVADVVENWCSRKKAPSYFQHFPTAHFKDSVSFQGIKSRSKKREEGFEALTSDDRRVSDVLHKNEFLESDHPIYLWQIYIGDKQQLFFN